MQQLTGLDASFLALETKNSTGHVGGVCILDPSEAPKPLDLATLTEVMAQIAKSQQASIPQGLVDDISEFAPGLLVDELDILLAAAAEKTR